ncbi:MAG TPA: response regulator [Polyangia bacterium]|nr:response regulator [Polyangia bacterium]
MGVTGESLLDPQSAAADGDDQDTRVRPVNDPRRLLLVEDDFTLRAHLAELLMQEGYYVGCAADGVEAVRRLQTEPLPDAILLDIVLPRMNGVAVRKAQLQSPSLRAIPTVAITSMQDRTPMEGLEFSAVFRKPVDFDLLMRTLNRICPLS